MTEVLYNFRCCIIEGDSVLATRRCQRVVSLSAIVKPISGNAYRVTLDQPKCCGEESEDIVGFIAGEWASCRVIKEVNPKEPTWVTFSLRLESHDLPKIHRSVIATTCEVQPQEAFS